MLYKTTAYAAFAATLSASLAAPAAAELPEPVRAMIEAAIATGDEAKARTVIEIARSTNPGDAAEIDALLAGYETDLAQAATEKAAAEEAAIRNAGLFDNWSGRGELGAFNATGNSSNTGLTGSLSLTREGINWRHKLRARADYQRSNGVTSREQFVAAYEPNLKLNDRLFAYALAQYERDRFQGFSARYALSGGLGYDVIDSDAVKLSVKAGPALRRTEFIDGSTETRIGGLFGADFDWNITDRIKLTQDANAVAESAGSATVIVDSSNTSIDLVTGLNAKISDSLSARVSYAIEYDSNPPVGAKSTDTLSRVTIIYDF